MPVITGFIFGPLCEIGRENFVFGVVMKILRFVFLILAAGHSSYGLAETDHGSTPLKSPYFIDGIHCQGLDGEIDSDEMRKAYTDEETAVVGIKVLKQQLCEGIFSSFGVEKFQWLTPEDLETLVFSIRYSKKYRNVEVKVEKSQLQNHVHLIGKFEPYKSVQKLKINVLTAVEKGGATGDRQTKKVDAEIGINHKGPTNLPQYRIGITSIVSNANAPLSADELKSGDKDVILSESEKISLSRNYGEYESVYAELSIPTYSSGLDKDFFLRVNNGISHMSGDTTSDIFLRFEAGGIFHPHLQNSKLRASLVYINDVASSSEYKLKDKADSTSAKPMYFATFSGEQKFQKMNLSFEVQRSLTSDIHLYFQETLEFHLFQPAGFKTSAGIDLSYLRGSVLPEHRFGLSDSRELQFYGKVAKDFRLLNSDSNAFLKVGSNSYSSTSLAKNSYFQNSAVGELGVSTKTEQFDVGLAFIYGNRRLF
jgi:hypothetical protein